MNDLVGKIEVGKTYLTREGSKVTITHDYRDKHKAFYGELSKAHPVFRKNAFFEGMESLPITRNLIH